jgi:hypothetical protein
MANKKDIITYHVYDDLGNLISTTNKAYALEVQEASGKEIIKTRETVERTK